jgi:hypothetical protein
MARIPWYVVIAVGLVLILGISAFFFLVPVRGIRKSLAANRTTYQGLKTSADQVQQAESQLEQAKSDAGKVEHLLQQKIAQRSAQYSGLYPLELMFNLWPEYNRLAALIRDYVQQSGCRLVAASALPSPPVTPVEVPANGFLQIPQGGSISLTLQGSLADIERFYRSLRNFPRTVTVSGLALSGSGERLTANVNLAVYLLVEAPPPAAAPAAAAGGMGGGTGMGMGMGSGAGATKSEGDSGTDESKSDTKASKSKSKADAGE